LSFKRKGKKKSSSIGKLERKRTESRRADMEKGLRERAGICIYCQGQYCQGQYCLLEEEKCTILAESLLLEVCVCCVLLTNMCHHLHCMVKHLTSF